MSKPVIDKQSRITLKSIKHLERASQKSTYFQAFVYLDGKKAMNAFNDGKGFRNEYWEFDGQSTPDFLEMLTKCTKYGGDFMRAHGDLAMVVDDEVIDLSGLPDQELLDCLIQDLLNEHFCLKKMKESLKSGIVIFDIKENVIFSFQLKPTDIAMSLCKETYSDESHNWIYLNDLSQQEAFKLWRKST